MSVADHGLNFNEQTQIAMGFSEEDSEDRELQAAIQASLSLYPNELSGEDTELYDAIAASLGIDTSILDPEVKRELYDNIAASLGIVRHHRLMKHIQNH